MRIEEENLVTSITVGGGGGGASALSQLSDVYLPDPQPNQYLKYNGSKWVAASGGGSSGVTELNDLSDVYLPDPQPNQYLKYNGSQWVAASGGGGVNELSSLEDVMIDTESLSGGELLSYNDYYGKWVSLRLILDSFIDSTYGGFSGPNKLLYTTEQQSSTTAGAYEWGYLSLDSDTLEINNGVLSAIGNGATKLKQLLDVNSNLSTEGDEVLFYNSSISKWDSKQLELALDDLSDVNTYGAQDGYVLTCNSQGTWVAQAPSGGSGPSTTYYADGTTLTLNSTTFSVLSTPALQISNTNYSLPTLPNGVSNKWYYLSIGTNSYGNVCLDWTEEYGVDNTTIKYVNGVLTAELSLDELTNVSVDNALSGQYLKFNGSTWVASGGSSGGGATELKELSDVDSSLSPTNGQILVYNAGQWEAQTPSGSSTPLVWEEH